MRALGIEPPSIALTGGGAGSELWRAILAAQLRVPLSSVAAGDGPALGAAILAQVGAALHPDVAAAVAAAVPAAAAPVTGDPALADRYRRLHARYTALYPALKAAGAFAGEP
jgi:xylulokinase